MSKPSMDERFLVEAAQRDPARFVELYDLHFERVYAYIVRRVGNRADAEDLTSHVFHQALEHLPRFQWRGVPFAVWLFRIAANAIRDSWKRKTSARPAGAVGGDPSHSDSETWVDPVSLEEAERHARLFRMVEDLPETQRRVVVMRFVEERSIREIAEAIGRSEGAVKQLQFRALRSLRAWMSELYG